MTMKNADCNEGRICQEFYETTYLVAGYVVLGGYMKYHNGIFTEELFSIRKQVAVKGTGGVNMQQNQFQRVAIDKPQ
jgi:hypothetical protein